MPNYVVVNNAQFNPFTYQELTAPLDRMEAYHEKLAQEYDNLSSQADILEAMGNDDRDKNSGVYGRYKAYSDSLRKEADNLYRYGLNVESRRRLSDLRRRYNTEIVPIQNAWNKRDEEAKAQLDASVKNPLLKFSRNAKDTPLEYYINNPQGGYDAYDLKNVYTMTAAMAKTLAKQAREGRKEYIDNVTYRFITPYGLDPNLINDWQSNPDASPTLTNMVSQALVSNGITADNPIYQEALNIAKLGTWEAVGEDKEHIQNDQARLLNMQAAKEIGVARAKEAISGSGTESNAPWFNFHQDSIPIASADKNNPAGYVNGYWQNYKNDSWSGKARVMRVQEIKGTDKDGKLQLKSDIINLGQLLQKNDKYNPNNETVSSFFTNQEGQEGYIFQVNGKQYFADISADRSDDVLNARNSFKQANNAVAQIAAKKQELNNIRTDTSLTYQEKQNLQAQIAKEIRALEEKAQRNTSNGLSSLGAAHNQYTNNPAQAVVEQPSQTQQFKKN